MLDALERGGVRGMDLPCRRLEGWDRSACVPSLGYGIAASASDLPQPHSLLACLLEWHERDTPEPDVAAFPFDDGP